MSIYTHGESSLKGYSLYPRYSVSVLFHFFVLLYKKYHCINRSIQFMLLPCQSPLAPPTPIYSPHLPIAFIGRYHNLQTCLQCCFYSYWSVCCLQGFLSLAVILMLTSIFKCQYIVSTSAISCAIHIQIPVQNEWQLCSSGISVNNFCNFA